MKKHSSFPKILNRWYRKNARDLPFRETEDPYKIWISEIMLQQTTVNAVIPYYKEWIRKFPRVEEVARAPLQKILNTWQGLGYYQRARNIHAAAQIIVNKFNSKIPRDPEDLKTLPGFGPYTIGAVLSIAYDLKYPIVDANVRRVFMRLLAIKGQANPSVDPQILPVIQKLLPEKNMKIFNQALMELGALVCRNREPLCVMCPLRKMCKAFDKGLQEIIPAPKSMVYKELDVVIGILKKRNKYFIQKRPSKGLLADLWEFPGGKIKKGESKPKALFREIKEECGIQIQGAKPFMHTLHFYTNHRVKLHVYFCTTKEYPRITETRRWVTLKEMESFPMPSGSAKIVDKLRKQ